MKKLLVAIVSVAVLVGVAACSGPGSKTYTDPSGFSITMPSGFTEQDQANYTAYYETTATAFFALKASFADLASAGLTAKSTTGDYLNAVMAANSPTTTLQPSGDLKYFTYQRTVAGKDYFYLATAYKTANAFWLFQFASEQKNAATYQASFLQWAGSITFS